MIFIDNNLPFSLKTCFEGNVIHASDIGFSSVTDNTIWEYCKIKSLCILTKDSDFEDLSNYYGQPPKVVKLTCGNKGTKELKEILIHSIPAILSFIEDENSALLILK